MDEISYFPQPLWLSCESELKQTVMTALYKSDVMKIVNGNIFDIPQQEIKGDTYIMLGDSTSSEREVSMGMTEQISLNFHIYHRNLTYPESSTHELARLMDIVKSVVRNRPTFRYYECKKAEITASEVFTDIDNVTKHGVIRVRYTVRHQLKH